MHRHIGANDLATESLPYTLQAKANAEQGDFGLSGRLDKVEANASLIGTAGAWR